MGGPLESKNTMWLELRGEEGREKKKKKAETSKAAEETQELAEEEMDSIWLDKRRRFRNGRHLLRKMRKDMVGP